MMAVPGPAGSGIRGEGTGASPRAPGSLPAQALYVIKARRRDARKRRPRGATAQARSEAVRAEVAARNPAAELGAFPNGTMYFFYLKV